MQKTIESRDNILANNPLSHSPPSTLQISLKNIYNRHLSPHDERMERNGGMLWALFLGIEPIIVGVASSQQRLIFLGLINLLILLVWHSTSSMRNNGGSHTALNTPIKPTHSTASLQSSRSQNKHRNTYFGAIASAAIIGGIVAFRQNHGEFTLRIAGALIAAGCIFWLLSLLVHGLTKTWRHMIAKLFGLLILAGAGRGILSGSNSYGIRGGMKNIFGGMMSVPAVVAPGVSGSLTPPQTPITAATGTEDIASEAQTGIAAQAETPPANSGAIPAAITQPVLAPSTPVTYADLIPVLVQKFNLSSSGPEVSFTNISRTSPLYPAFKAAYKARFFGAGINPAGKVPCNIYFVLLGLAQKWNVPHTAANLFPAYAAEATARGQTYGCVAGATMTSQNLPQ